MVDGVDGMSAVNACDNDDASSSDGAIRLIVDDLNSCHHLWQSSRWGLSWSSRWIGIHWALMRRP